MKKIVPMFILLAALLLTACGGTGQSPVITATVEPTIAPTSAPTQAAPTSEPTATPTPIPGGCQTTSLLPAPDPIFPPITDADWQKGPKDAIVTILVYSDFQCPYCAQVAPMLDDLLQKYPQDVRIVYRHLPLNIHDKALISAQAAEAAGIQGKFWEMHDLLMTQQSTWTTMVQQDFVSWVTDQAKSISGLDVSKFSQDLTSQPVVAKVQAALDSANQIGLNQTPFLVLNGRAFYNTPDDATIGSIVTLFKTLDNTLTPILSPSCPPQIIEAGKQYSATITTTKGDFTMQLFADKAPLAVNSFIYLAQRGWFNNTPFHRVIAGFVAQTGDPSGTGMGNPGYEFNNEISPDLKFDKAGMVGMANAGANTNGSQFFITYDALPQLDGSYTIFGQVTSGMDVVTQLTQLDPQFGQPETTQPDKIVSVTINVQ